MNLTFDRHILIKNASFSAHIRGQDLVLPALFERLCAAGMIQHCTVEDLLEIAYSYPGTIARLLDWSMDEVETARCELIIQLEGYVEEKYLLPPKTPRGGKPPG